MTAPRTAWFEQAAVAQATVDREGRFLTVNRALAELLGRAPESLLGEPVAGLNHGSDGGEDDEMLRRVLTGRQRTARAERVVAAADGRPVPVLADLSVLQDEDGHLDGAFLLWHDLTALREAEHGRKQQQELFLTLSRRANDLALITDADGTLVYVSPAVRHMLGYEATDVVTRVGWDFVHPDDLASAQAVFADVIAGGGSREMSLRVRDAAGRSRWMEETVTNLLDTAVGGVVCNLRDVTDRVEAEQALRRSEARYRAIVDTATEGIWAVGTDGRTLHANARMAEILGVPLQTLYDVAPVALLDEEQSRRLLRRLAGGAEPGIERYEITYQHAQAGERVLAVAATSLESPDGGAEGSLAMVSDVTEARRSERQLRHAALHDALTGLPNRTLLLDRLEHALARERTATAVVFLDIDHFKLINDSRGHGVGDDLLVVVAQRLRDEARPSDTVARFGGDEFVVVLEDVDEQQAEAVAQQLLAAVGEPIDVGRGPMHVRASLGIALSPPRDATDLLRFADAAMYAAKAAGRGRVQRFDRSLADEAEQRYALAGDLRAAIAEDALSVHYQPVVDLQSGQVLGVEALARWEHPVHGPVPPSRFVPVAELGGLAADLDSWVLSRALRDAAALRASGATPPDAYVAVNVSARHLSDLELESRVVTCAAAAGLPPSHVVLEITEGAIMDDPERAVGLLGRLRAQGFGIAIDDFGTGYSSLAYLRDLPITTLKVDMSFTAHITRDPDALAIVASIVDLARAVGVRVVAEGVETAEQAALLRQLGCPAGQGWLWSHPVPVEELSARRSWSHSVAEVAAAAPRARRRALRVGPEHGIDRLLALHGEGASLATIAAALNSEGFRTPGGRRWHATSVARAVAGSAYPGLAQS